MINETKATNPLQTISANYIDSYEEQTVHRILVTPKFRKNGRYWCTKAGPLFDARYNGELLCSSVQPLLASARVLKARGFKGTIEMWHDGTDYACQTMSIEAAADLKVREGRRTPEFINYKPFQGRAKLIQATTLPPYPEIGADALTGTQGIESRIPL